MAENRRGKDNRFYFSRGQMVLLGGAFTLMSVIIFGLGIFVGKGIEESKVMKREEPLIKIPASPPNQGAGGAKASAAKDEITFNDSLEKPVGAQPLAEQNTKEPKPAEKVAKAQPKDAKTQVKAEPPADKTANKKTENSAPAGDAPKRTEPDGLAEPKDESTVWRAQVNAFPDERSAKQLVERLKNKGYNAYVTEAQNRGKTWYRVSVGKYASRDEADKMAEALKSKESYTKTFAASK